MRIFGEGHQNDIGISRIEEILILDHNGGALLVGLFG
jgi:hypothetical protein